jgi:hypothetical protein
MRSHPKKDPARLLYCTVHARITLPEVALVIAGRYAYIRQPEFRAMSVVSIIVMIETMISISRNQYDDSASPFGYKSAVFLSGFETTREVFTSIHCLTSIPRQVLSPKSSRYVASGSHHITNLEKCLVCPTNLSAVGNAPLTTSTGGGTSLDQKLAHHRNRIRYFLFR